MFVFTITDVIQLTILGVLVLGAAVWFLYSVIKDFYVDVTKWKCVKHNYKLWRTNSFGNTHWFKCDKCGKEKLQ